MENRDKIWKFFLWWFRSYIIFFIICFGVLTPTLSLLFVAISAMFAMIFIQYDIMVDDIAKYNTELQVKLAKLEKSPYQLTEAQEEKMLEFKNKSKNKSGFEIVFSHANGIGWGVDVRSRDGKEKLDLTDYSTW